MYNETIYNVVIAPHIENQLFRKRSVFTTWLWTGIIFLLFDFGYSIYDFIYKNNKFAWVNMVISVMGILYICWGTYIIFCNPLRKYHVSLQIYLYLIFMDYFYFRNSKYPNGFGKKMQYVIIVQTCINSIDKYIKIMETLLISGDNTIAHIKYLRALRNLLYKMKGEVFFKSQIAAFRIVLDHYYSGIHIGLKAILDFDENVEYFECTNFDVKVKECNDILSRNDVAVENEKLDKNDKISNIRHRTLIVFLMSIIATMLVQIILPYSIWNQVVSCIAVLANLIQAWISLKNSK